MSSATSPAKYGAVGASARSGSASTARSRSRCRPGRPPQVAHQIVRGHTIEPGAGIVGAALSRPSRERSHERTLDSVLDKVEMPDANPAREQRHQPAVFVPEEMFDQVRCGACA